MRAVIAIALLCSPLVAQLDFDGLLYRMTRPESMLEPWPDGTRHVLFSSRDPASDAGPADPDAWFSNSDSGHHPLGVEDGRGRDKILADVKGAGVVTRLWFSAPRGRVRIHVDGAMSPVIAGDIGKLADDPAMLGRRTGGAVELRLPVPFARSLRILATEPRFAYEVDVMRAPADAGVESLTSSVLRASRKEVRALGALLAERLGPPVKADSARPIDLKRGERMKVDVTGASKGRLLTDVVIRGLKAKDLPRALRRTMIALTFDGRETLRVPLGLLFGAGARGGPHRGVVSGCVREPGGLTLYNRLVMPYAKTASITLQNATRDHVSGTLSWRTAPLPDGTPVHHLHATLRQWTRQRTRPLHDLNLCDLAGAGKVVGCALTIRNPVRNFWGEGDPKVFVDDDALPAVFSTGADDWFGVGNGTNERLTGPWGGQPWCDGPGNHGITTLVRWHVIDPLPFAERLRFDLGLRHWKDCEVDLTSAVFWYEGAGGAAEARPWKRSEVPTWRDIGAYVPKSGVHLLEGEALPFEAKSGKAVIQDMRIWSGGKQIWWSDPVADGGELIVTFPAPRAGRYRVLGRFTLARDYGRHELRINDAPAPFLHDFYDPKLRVTPDLDLGTFTLTKEDNRLHVQCRGRHEKAVDRRMFGLDYLRLVPER